MSARYSEIPRGTSHLHTKVIRKMSCFDVRDDDRPRYSQTRNFSTNSLPRPGSGTTRTSSSPIEVIRIPPDELASQLTIIDNDLFRKVDLEELTSCGWIKKNKQQIAPNVVEYTRRFNHVSYWVIEEILNQETPKTRAEVMSYFIRVAKRLHDLNNLHSLFAIVSALRSASVYRLQNTWAYLSRKDKQTSDKFVDLFSDNDNWAKLRDHMDLLKLPCVPYIGVYLTDLVYLSVANPNCSLKENSAANNIFRIITTYQSESSYDHIPKDYCMQAKLRSIRYIDELLKFVEDDNYKKSLKLEPQNNEQASGQQTQPSPLKFIPGHRKNNSWGNRPKLIGSESSSAESIRNLIDGSILEKSQDSITDPNIVVPETDSDDVVLDGCLRRKTLLKNGKKPTMASWQRYWVQLWGPTLLYYSSKSLTGTSRSDFKLEPCKMKSIQGWLVQMADDPLHPDSFVLADPNTGVMYKFRTGSHARALVWCRKLQECQRRSNGPTNLINFDET